MQLAHEVGCGLGQSLWAPHDGAGRPLGIKRRPDVPGVTAGDDDPGRVQQSRQLFERPHLQVGISMGKSRTGSFQLQSIARQPARMSMPTSEVGGPPKWVLQCGNLY